MIMTPWLCQEEWEIARDLVLNRDFSVMKYFDVWRLRVSRLPAGVETTASLVQALATSPHTSLSLATAVNRSVLGRIVILERIRIRIVFVI